MIPAFNRAYHFPTYIEKIEMFYIMLYIFNIYYIRKDKMVLSLHIKN